MRTGTRTNDDDDEDDDDDKMMMTIHLILCILPAVHGRATGVELCLGDVITRSRYGILLLRRSNR